MSSRNKNMNDAREEKSMDYYTRLEDICDELNNYSDKFEGKVVYCNCDDPFESNFVKFFLTNFNRLKLKELIATGYSVSLIRGAELELFDTAYVIRVASTKDWLVGTQTDLDVKGAKCFLKEERDNVAFPLRGNPAVDENGNPVQVSVKEEYTTKNGNVRKRTVKRDLFYEAGDFRSDICVEFLKEADIVVTNPPFALFTEFISQLVKYDKQFIIIGNKNSVTLKEVFPLIRDGKVWLGVTPMSRDMLFVVPEEKEKELRRISTNGKKYRIVDGQFYARVGAVWFTNVDHAKRHVYMPFDGKYVYEGHEETYQKYDNFDAIHISEVDTIPADYDGVMGVPISFLGKFCPEQFEIIGITNHGAMAGIPYKDNNCFAEINGKRRFIRLFIKRKG